jgi:L-aspartate oxidase
MTMQCDALVLGAGFSGLRAAWSALEARPGARVVVACGSVGASGSSFLNRNHRLGFQYPDTDQGREALILSAKALGRPGWVEDALVEVLALEAEPRIRELMDLGLQFRRDEAGKLERVPGCFTPNLRTGVVLEGLDHAHQALTRKVADLGGELLTGYEVLDLLVDETDRSVAGAVLGTRDEEADRLHVQAGATVLALGGPASLFAYDISGPGNTGVGYGLLELAGAALENAGFVQFMWHTVPGLEFFPLERLAEGASVRTAGGDIIPVPEAVGRLAPVRAQHAPAAYQLPDAEVDRFLAAYMDLTGYTSVKPADVSAQEEWVRISPMAHAGNGGARIDSEGGTTAPGLYALGECATGMHGANRIGGAMTTATQVFGHRAGAAAARRAAETERPPASRLTTLLGPHAQPVERSLKKEGWLREQMQRCAVLGGRAGLKEFKAELGERLETSRGHSLRLRSARVVVRHLLEYRKQFPRQ